MFDYLVSKSKMKPVKDDSKEHQQSLDYFKPQNSVQMHTFPKSNKIKQKY